MAGRSKLWAYGENAATFLLFQEFEKHEGGMRLFLDNLKLFGKGTTRRPPWPLFSNLEVWLFPNFGKSQGFGEPDVLVIAKEDERTYHSFWVEVETTINCRAAKTALRHSLVQLWRFFLFQQALKWPAKTIPGVGLRVEGRSVSIDKETRALVARDAHVWLADHKVMSATREHLRLAGRAGNDHYVLFTIGQPTGSPGLDYDRALQQAATPLTVEGIESLPARRCWYSYWVGDLEEKYKDAINRGFALDDVYVAIKGK